MSHRQTIIQLGKAVSREIRRGELSEDTLIAGPMLASAGATAELVDCLFTEARRKRPNDQMLDAYVHLLRGALDALRLDVSGGSPQARQGLEAVRTEVAKGLDRGGIPAAVLMLVGRAFAGAQLDPGQLLQAAVMNAIQAEGVRGDYATGPGAGGMDHLRDIAKKFDNDPFAIHADLAASGAAFPAEHRLAIIAALASSAIPAIRESALGFVLDPDADIAAAVLAELTRPGSGQPVSSVAVERLVRMRPWLPEDRRPSLDAAIRALRPKATAPQPAVRPEIRAVLASLCDGVGAQSLFTLVKRGRHLAIASVMVKEGVGVADAWVRDGMTKAESDNFIEQIDMAVDPVNVSIGFVERRVADALAVNAARNAPPPFGLLQVMETLGLGTLQPQAVSAAELIGEVLADVPAARTDAQAVVTARRASARWTDIFDTLSSWFEAGEEVEALLRQLKSRRARIDAMLTTYLPAHRMIWATRCAWTAALFKEDPDAKDQNWIDFALVARDFAGDQNLTALPIAKQIAETSVNAFESQSQPR